LFIKDDDEARREVHQKGRHADGHDVLDDAFLQFVDAAAEVQQFVLVGENAELPHERYDLRQHRGDGGSADAPAEAVDEKRIEHRVDDDGVDGRIHRLARVARGAEHGFEP